MCFTHRFLPSALNGILFMFIGGGGFVGARRNWRLKEYIRSMFCVLSTSRTSGKIMQVANPRECEFTHSFISSLPPLNCFFVTLISRGAGVGAVCEQGFHRQFTKRSWSLKGRKKKRKICARARGRARAHGLFCRQKRDAVHTSGGDSSGPTSPPPCSPFEPEPILCWRGKKYHFEKKTIKSCKLQIQVNANLLTASSSLSNVSPSSSLLSPEELELGLCVYRESIDSPPNAGGV